MPAESNLEHNSELRQKLKFRRQFLISNKIYSPNKYWNTHKLKHGLTLSLHTDLCFFSKEKDGNKITLIGIAVDCQSPFRSYSEITNGLLNNFDDIWSVIKASKPLAGRWILVCQNAENTFIFHDPCGLRQIYFTHRDIFCCASQPTLIKQVAKLPKTSNKSILKLRSSTSFIDRESAWVGRKTLYENCFKLMPNHFLDVKQGDQVRFFPKKAISKSDNTKSLADTASKYLQNILVGLADKFPIEINLSAGFDSRLLLAASNSIFKNVKISTDKLGLWKEYHADIYIPRILAKKFDLDHEVINSNQNPSELFYELLTENISIARTSSVNKTKSIYNALINRDNKHLQINGNAVEIVRIHEQDLKYVYSGSLDKLINFYGYNNSYVHEEITKWFNDVNQIKLEGISIYNLFYWEQRMAHWGALFPAELDIAAETISPFNCRSLLEVCFEAPLDQRKAPDFILFRLIIKNLWPELLSVPINPEPKGWGLVKKRIREALPSNMVDVIQRIRKKL